MTWRHKRTILVSLSAVLVVGMGILIWNAGRIQLYVEDYRLRHAQTPEARSQSLARLFQHGDRGVDRLIAILRQLDAEAVQALREPLREQMTAALDHDVPVDRLLGVSSGYPQAVQELLLVLVPEVIKRDRPKLLEACRSVVRQALEAPAEETRVLALRLAVDPKISLHTESRHSLKDPSALVRTSALLLLGSLPGVLTEEELFGFLHDPDLQVRQTAEATLYAHGRTAREIVLGRKLTDPQAVERLQLLVDLAHDNERDIQPWLERLARDPEPAVRAGAARLAIEARLPFVTWIDTLAREDSDPLVRNIASFYRSQRSTLTPVGGQ